MDIDKLMCPKGMSNGAAIGYMILAARQLGLDSELIRQLARAMAAEMDYTDETDAETAYQCS